ncbi:MAG: hypothetical protein H5T95_08205 [Firmicutes bacterium]|nr:hypothetical protein [Bacillota bacterium]
MSWFVYVIRAGVDEPTPERQHPEQRSSERQLLERGSAVRDHVVRRLQEPTPRRRGSRFPAIGLGDGGQGAGWGAAGISALTHLQPFYRAEFGFEEGNFPATEFPEFAQFAEPAGHTSIAIPIPILIPIRYRFRSPGRRGDRLRGRRPRAGAGGGAVGVGTVLAVAKRLGGSYGAIACQTDADGTPWRCCVGPSVPDRYV